jgi:hypothetical protein
LTVPPARVDGLSQRDVSDGFDAEHVGNLAQDDIDANSGQEAEHHRMGHESEVSPDMGERRHYHDQASEQSKKDQGVTSLLLRDTLQRRPRRQSRRARRRNHHQSGAGRHATGDRSSEAGVKTVDRIDACQHAGCHAVRDAADGTRQASEDVGLKVCPSWPYERQPGRPGCPSSRP